MKCKLSLLVLLICVINSATVAKGQCSKGGGAYGGGHHGGHDGGGHPFPTYPQPGLPTYPSNPFPSGSQLPTQFPPVTDGIPLGDFSQSNTGPLVDSLADVPVLSATDHEDLAVFVLHPVTGKYVLTKEFKSRSKANAFKANIERRFFVTYSDETGNVRFREASDATMARSITNELKSAGNKLTGVQRASARIGDPNAFQDDESELANLKELLTEVAADSATTMVPETTAPAPVTEPDNDEINPADLTFLVGQWQAVARTDAGELTTIELKLDEDGWATLTLPADDGSRPSVKRKAELRDGQLLLTGGESEINLGKLASFDADQVVLKQLFGQVTFVRP